MPWRSARSACAFATWLAAAAATHPVDTEMAKHETFGGQNGQISPNTWPIMRWVGHVLGKPNSFCQIHHPSQLEDVDFMAAWEFFFTMAWMIQKLAGIFWFRHRTPKPSINGDAGFIIFFLKKLLDICPDPRVFFFVSRRRRNGKNGAKQSLKHIFEELNWLATIWVFPKIGVPQNGRFMMEYPIKMDDLGENPLFICIGSRGPSHWWRNLVTTRRTNDTYFFRPPFRIRNHTCMKATIASWMPPWTKMIGVTWRFSSFHLKNLIFI